MGNANGHEARGLAHGVVGSVRMIAFAASNVAPAGAVVGGLVIVVSYAGFASPLVIILAFVASMCCASSIAEFARRLPSAGSLYTYNSRALGRTGGFLTGWMMVFAYALYFPAGVSLTSAYASQLVSDVLHVTIDGWGRLPGAGARGGPGQRTGPAVRADAGGSAGFEGGYPGLFELICPSCGDQPDLDYSEIPPWLLWLRGRAGWRSPGCVSQAPRASLADKARAEASWSWLG